MSNEEKESMTTKQGLTGQELLERVAELGAADVAKEDLLRGTGWFQGYAEDGSILGFADLYNALLEAKGIDMMRTQEPDVIEGNVSRLAVLGYRWLVYQYDLDNGYEDKRLEEQQDEFFDDLVTAVKELRSGLPDQVGMIATDVLGVMTHLIAYIRTNRWTPDNIPTDEERRENFMVVLKWAQDTKLVKQLLEIANTGLTEEEIKDYDEFRWPHHTKIANYFRTVTLDFTSGSHHQEVDAFAEELQDVKAFISMLNENSVWTTRGLFYMMISAMRFDWRTEKDKQELIEFANNLVYTWLEEGDAIRAEFSK